MSLLNSIKAAFVATQLSPEEMSRVKQLIDSVISGSVVAVFSKSYCPYCSRAKTLLTEKLGGNASSEMKIVELDEDSDGAAIQDALARKAGKSRVTVPQIYIGQELVGGCDDLFRAESSGQLVKLLADRRASMA